jgi:hypothetical protein
MANSNADTSQHTAAKVAGWAYLLIILTSILVGIFGPYSLTVEGDAAATFNNIMANEFLFRIGAAYDTTMFASVILLALALYVVLKPVNQELALLAMLWRFAEAVLGFIMVLCSLIVLLLVKGENYAAVFEPGQLQALVGLFLDVNPAALSILFVLISLGTIVNCYLFYKSQYIPRILAIFGIFSFTLMLIGTYGIILLPNYTATINMVIYPPATLFEVAIGLWLIIKGINVEYWDNRAAASD